MARSSLLCNPNWSSPISSMNRVPPSAAWNKPAPPLGRPSERALLVAEKLAFNQRLGNGSTIDRNKWKTI